MDIYWRPPDWEKTKGAILMDATRKTDVLDSIMEQIATTILMAYSVSNQFGEDASEYARETGWREPS